LTFESLRLAEPLLRAVTADGYTTPTPIQAKAIPHALAGSDLLGCAQTGTGKTAAFALPILHLLSSPKADAAAPVVAAAGSHAPAHAAPHAHKPRPHGPARQIRAVVLSPTRELAVQIADSFESYGRHLHLRHATVYGGVGYGAQITTLRRGVDILVATPGRMMDLMEQGCIDLSKVEIFVLDEADRMLDMGFIEPIRRIVSKIPKERQTLMFSATMPPDIRRLAESILRNPVSVEVKPVASTTELVDQALYNVARGDKALLLVHLLRQLDPGALSLIFTRTKHGADKLVKDLHRASIRAEAIHGNKRQNVRQRTLNAFRGGDTPVLVATDVAARGIDVDNIALVVNYDLPNEPETYIHRIGRTGRAGAKGRAVAFCDREERSFLRDIERLIRKVIPVRTDHPDYSKMAAEMPRPVHAPRAHHDEVSHRGGHSPRPGGGGGGHHAPARRPAHKAELGHAKPRPRVVDQPGTGAARAPGEATAKPPARRGPQGKFKPRRGSSPRF